MTSLTITPARAQNRRTHKTRCNALKRNKQKLEGPYVPSFLKEPIYEFIQPITDKLDSIDKRLERIEHATRRFTEKSDGNYVKLVDLDEQKK